MDHTRHIGRCIVVGVGALALWGAGTAAATTPPTEPLGDTATGASEPMTGAGPSDCPAITEAPATEAPTGSEPMATEAAGTAPAATTGDSMAPEGSVAAVSGPFLQIAESDEYGPVLVDSACRTVYVFANDADGEPTCVDDCATNWPPLFVTGDAVPPLADELDPSLFTVVEHPEGPQLKVGDWPLYYFAGDTGPGQTNGQGVGGVWWLVAPDGIPVEDVEEIEGSEGTVGPGDTAPPMTTGG